MKITDWENVQKFKFSSDDNDTMAVRLREIDWLADKIPEGEILEFGVFKGVTINRLAEKLPNRKIVGFDSFEGLPEDWDMGEKYTKKEAFDRGGVMPDVPETVTLVKGFFEDTLPDYKKDLGNIGFLHADADLYSSTKTVLDELNHLIVPGTIIRFDELCCWRLVFGEASPKAVRRVKYKTWKDHEWKALLEWMETYNRKVVPLCRNWFQGGTVVVTQ
jgi:predicted O-methyltransferase YrrM